MIKIKEKKFTKVNNLMQCRLKWTVLKITKKIIQFKIAKLSNKKH